jgi:hypothetical protein
LGAPSTLRQLHHVHHVSDIGEPRVCNLLELHDDGGVECRVVTAR